MKKIVFFTELDWYGKVDRKYTNMRTEFAWMAALNAIHCNLYKYNQLYQDNIVYDLGIIIIPKFKSNFNLNFNIFNLRKDGKVKKFAVMQEGPNDYFQNYEVKNQIIYYNFISNCDFLLCHNECDINYFKGLTNLNTYALQSLMITDSIKNININKEKSDAIIIGGNFCTWYNGFDSWIIARELNIKMYAPSMGRKSKDEDKIIKDVIYINYLDWKSWNLFLNEHIKYGIHLMRVYAAGTFFLNTAYWGIPSIGYNLFDTSRILHPELSIEPYNLEKASKLAYKLVYDKDFYKYCSEQCRKNYEKYYSESIFIEKFNQILNKEYI